MIPSSPERSTPNLAHSFLRGPGGSTSYVCRCGAQEKYTSADTVCPLAQEAVTRSVLNWLGLPFTEDVQNCKGGRVVRFLVDLGKGEECFLPLQSEEHSLMLWVKLPQGCKNTIADWLTHWSGPVTVKGYVARKWVLSQAGYEAQAHSQTQLG